MNGEYKKGSKEIDAYICEHYPTMKTKLIADKFDLKTGYISYRAFQLGVVKVKQAKKTEVHIKIIGNRLIHRCI
jgi:hypothetical protein